MLAEIETSGCGVFGGREFRFKVDRARVLDADVDWLIATLEGMVSRGGRFREGETIQIGWGLLKTRMAL